MHLSLSESDGYFNSTLRDSNTSTTHKKKIPVRQLQDLKLSVNLPGVLKRSHFHSAQAIV